MDNIKQVIDQEIKWHKANRGMTENVDFEKGFIAGLKQANKLLASLQSGSYCVACCEECRHGNCSEMCEKCRALAKKKKEK